MVNIYRKFEDTFHIRHELDLESDIGEALEERAFKVDVDLITECLYLVLDYRERELMTGSGATAQYQEEGWVAYLRYYKEGQDFVESAHSWFRLI